MEAAVLPTYVAYQFGNKLRKKGVKKVEPRKEAMKKPTMDGFATYLLLEIFVLLFSGLTISRIFFCSILI